MTQKIKTKEEPHLLGRCGFCGGLIYSNEEYTIRFFRGPAIFEIGHKEGPIHKKCELDMLNQYNKELKREIDTLNELIVSLTSCKDDESWYVSSKNREEGRIY